MIRKTPTWFPGDQEVEIAIFSGFIAAKRRERVRRLKGSLDFASYRLQIAAPPTAPTVAIAAWPILAHAQTWMRAALTELGERDYGA